MQGLDGVMGLLATFEEQLAAELRKRLFVVSLAPLSSTPQFSDSPAPASANLATQTVITPLVPDLSSCPVRVVMPDATAATSVPRPPDVAPAGLATPKDLPPATEPMELIDVKSVRQAAPSDCAVASSLEGEATKHGAVQAGPALEFRVLREKPADRVKVEGLEQTFTPVLATVLEVSPRLRTLRHEDKYREHAPEVVDVSALAREVVAARAVAVVEQVARVIHVQAEPARREGKVEVQLRLDPPELGPVRIHLSATDQVLTARVVVHEEAARQVLENQLESLRVRLSDLGLTLGRFDVSRDHGHDDGRRQEREPVVYLPEPTLAPVKTTADPRTAPVRPQTGRIDCVA